MTSTASQQNPNPAPSTSAPSYASAAGATKKPASTPLIAPGSNPPPVVVGSSPAAAQNGKSSSASPVNGRPSITPALPAVSGTPAVAHGSHNHNGLAPDHSRKSSVTISANGPNSYAQNGGPVGGSKAGIQFGFQDSPGIAHSSPMPQASAPVPIPGNPRVPSPAHSPSPIPQPSASGGRPPPGMQPGGPQPTFGSFSGDGERQMRHQPSLPQNPMGPMGAQQNPAHLRKDSVHSIPGDMANHGGPNPNRGGYQGQGGRGRGFNGQSMGYPPSRQYSGPGAQGRGGMPPFAQTGRGGMPPQYHNSPQPHRASPAIPPAMPHQGTPQMPPAMPMQNPNPAFYPQYVNPPPPATEFSNAKNGKKRGQQRRSPEKFSRSFRLPDSSQRFAGSEVKQKGPRRLSRRWESTPGPAPDGIGHPLAAYSGDGSPTADPASSSSAPSAGQPVGRVIPSHFFTGLDLSPQSGQFEQILTATKAPQAFGGFPQYDQLGRPMNMPYTHYPHVGMMNNGPPQSPAPAYSQAYPQGQFAPSQPGPQPMSRNSSQISDRPASSLGHTQPPVIVQGTQQGIPAQPKAPVVASSDFVRPKRSAAIVIKNSQGQTVDLAGIKAQASPAPSIQQSKTPPIIASTPTPPPKSTTPASHTRTESAATVSTKTAEQLRNEFREQVRKTAEGPADIKAKADDEAEAEQPAADKAQQEDAARQEEHAQAQKKAEAEAKAKREAQEKAEADAKAQKEAESKAKAEAEAAATAAAAAAAAATAAAEKKAEKPADDEDDLERVIREMEEEDARREKEQAELTTKKNAEKEAAKKRDEEQRVADAADNDRKLREQERENERVEEEREKRRQETETKAAAGGQAKSVSDLLAEKISGLTLSEKKDASMSTSDAEKADDAPLGTPTGDGTSSVKAGASDKPKSKPAALNLTPLNTKPVEPPQPSAALQSLKSARFLTVRDQLAGDTYPAGILSPNPAVNAAVARKGKAFKYDAQFLLQFQKVFTEQPSLEFHHQVKSLIGENDGSRSAASARAPSGAGRQNSRTGGPGFPAMGSFGAPPPGKPLPPGTTSAERFAMSQGTMPRPNINPMASFARPGGAFPGGSQMARTPSSSNMGNMPHSPRIKSGRNSSRKDTFNAKAEEKAARTMPLTQGMDLRPITTSATGWKPSSVGSKAPPQGPGVLAPAQASLMDPEMVQRKVKAALNKMTPEKFDKISDQILLIAAQSKDEQDGRTLRQVIQLTFEKATDEAHWASMYAKFCKRMLETMSPEIRDVTILDKAGNVVNGGALFRKYLLNRCQEEFERGWKVDLPEPKEGIDEKKPSEAVMLSDDYYIAAAAKRRGLGLVQFIGELYKLGMLTERIMHECVRKLLEFQGVPDEAEIESLCKLLRTIGLNLDSTDKGKPMMDVYFQRIQHVIDLPELPSRLKFMLMDVVDLRRMHWASKEANKGPKTLKEIQADAEAQAAAKAAENARNSQRGGPGRPQMGRGDARSFSTYNQPAPNQVGMDDLRRLKGTATNRIASQSVTLGPTSMFSSRSNSGRRTGPGGALGRPGEDSGASSRTGTPPTTRERDSVAHTNAFGLLADTGEHPASPPSTVASPSLSKVVPDTTAGSSDEKKED